MSVRRASNVALRSSVAVATTIVAATSLIAGALGAGTAGAASLGASAGYEVSRAGGDRETQAAIGSLSLELGAGDLVLGALRFDDSQVGIGTGFILGGGIELAPATRLRLLGTRFAADDGYRALRLRAGPQWSLERATAGLFYTYDASDQAPDAHGATGELFLGLVPRLAGKLSASLASAEGVSGYAGGAGLIWTVVPHLELSGELGLARNLAAAGAGSPTGGLLDRVFGPGAGESSASDELVPTAVLGARVTFP
jgi:hypothetical protein